MKYLLVIITILKVYQFEGISQPCGDLKVEYSGKIYHTIQIGNQCWLRENLDVGLMIVASNMQKNNGKIEKYCLDNVEANCVKFGGLYQWNEAMGYTTSRTQGICPPGWDIPTLVEFEALTAAVNNDGNALKLKDEGLFDGKGTNKSGFSALLSGSRYYDGYFYYLGGTTGFWSSSQSSSNHASHLYLNYDDNGISLTNDYKVNGFSVRCVKD